MSTSDHLTYDEDDLALVHALQIHPRGSWSELAPVLGAPPGALARRWARMRADGLVWLTSYPRTLLSGTMLLAMVELQCAPAMLDGVAARLDSTPQVLTIEHSARGRDLVLTVVAGSVTALGALLLDELGRIPGVVSIQSHIAGRAYIDGSSWRLDALDAGQRRALAAASGSEREAGAAVDVTSPVFAPIVAELARDGRATAAAVAAAVDRPESTVRRQLAVLLRARALVFRCEVAQLRTRWPISASWWCRVPGNAVDGVVARLREDPRVRLCLSLTGPANLLVAAWTSSTAELTRMHTQLENLMVTGSIVDSSVVLRTRKRIGWLLHPDGRCTGVVVPPTMPFPFAREDLHLNVGQGLHH